MEVIDLSSRLTRKQNTILALDDQPSEDGNYLINRGMEEVLSQAILPFDYFTYLRELVERLPRRPKVLESGCGTAQILADLKRGLVFTARDLSFLGLMYGGFHEDTRNMILALIGKELKGLGDSIHTTGITLAKSHVEFVNKTNPRFGPDRMVVGTVQDYAQTTQDRYDFAFDFLGVAIREPRAAIRSYARLLEPGGEGLFRLSISSSNRVSRLARYVRDQELEIMDLRQPSEGGNQTLLDVLVKKR